MPNNHPSTGVSIHFANDPDAYEAAIGYPLTGVQRIYPRSDTSFCVVLRFGPDLALHFADRTSALVALAAMSRDLDAGEK